MSHALSISDHHATIEPAWIDYNRHFNVAYYVLLFDRALDETLDSLGLGPTYRQVHRCSVFVGEHHVVYDREVLAQSNVIIGSRVLAVDDRRLIAFQEMRAEGGADSRRRSREMDDRRLVATCETLCVHVDLTTRRTAAWPAVIRERLNRNLARTGEWPARAGRAIRLGRSG